MMREKGTVVLYVHVCLYACPHYTPATHVTLFQFCLSVHTIDCIELQEVIKEHSFHPNHNRIIQDSFAVKRSDKWTTEHFNLVL